MTTPDRGPNVFPAWFDRWQSRYINPLMRHVAPYLPTFAVIEHRGRRSGAPYATPVNAFRSGDHLVVVLGHGTTDWARNVLAAGEADARYVFRSLHLTNPRIIEPGGSDPGLPLVARLAGRRLGVFVADVAPG